LRNNAEKVQALRRSAILELQGEDVGQLMQKFAGVSIRSYGGLGGLKTISVRSLGSNHSSIVVDGFTLVNNQTGQINLGQLQTESLEGLQLIAGAQKNYLVPTSAQVSGSSLLIETFEASFSEHQHQVRFSSKVGSFGQFDNYLSYKYGRQRMYFSVFGKYRLANGTYPYSFRNGTTVYSGERLNNFYQDAMGGANLGFKTKKGGVFQLAYRKELVDQELPGAVILYSQNGYQTLKTINDRVQVSYLRHLNRWSVRAFSAYSAMSMVYTDSSYNDSSLIYRVDLDRRCVIEQFEIAFLDRLGSFGSFAFQLRAYEQGNVNKTTYKQDVKGLTSGGIWTYGTDEKGTRVINPTVEKTIQLNTNWLTIEMDNYFQELMTSPETYIKINGRYFACVINETSFEVARQKNKKLIMRSVSVTLSNQDSING
jgi:outer membrane cobalamin receptor